MSLSRLVNGTSFWTGTIGSVRYLEVKTVKNRSIDRSTWMNNCRESAQIAAGRPKWHKSSQSPSKPSANQPTDSPIGWIASARQNTLSLWIIQLNPPPQGTDFLKNEHELVTPHSTSDQDNSCSVLHSVSRPANGLLIHPSSLPGSSCLRGLSCFCFTVRSRNF